MFGMQIREGATFIRNFLCWHCLCVCVPNEVFRYRYRRYFTIIEYYRNGDVDPSLRTKRSQTVHCIIAIIISLTQCHALSDCEPSVENMMYTYVTTHTTFTGFRFIFEFSTKSRSRCSLSIPNSVITKWPICVDVTLNTNQPNKLPRILWYYRDISTTTSRISWHYRDTIV